MSILMILPVALVCFITYARSGSGRGGWVGKKVRGSDRWALEDAIHEKEQELEQLKALRIKHPIEP